MNKVMRTVVIFLTGMMLITYTMSGVDARKARAHYVLTKEKKEAAQQREKEKKALKKFEEDAREFAMYKACAIKTKAIEDEYIESPDAKASDLSSTDEYLFRAYLRTVKWDGDCFEWKDPAAAKKAGLSLKAYVIGGVHPVLKDQLHKLFIALESEECGEGTKCKPGITSAFRDDYRQQIASGYKARTGHSNHGGSKVTKGWGDGRAVDVVDVSEPDIFGDQRYRASEAMWHYIDKLGPKVGIYRPMPSRDPMHVESMGWLRSLIASGKRKVDEVVETVKKKTEAVIEKFKKNK